MSKFKYSLEEGSKKFTCPSCNKNNRYVRYINHETNEYLDLQYGRCDREQSCGYHVNPYQDIKSDIIYTPTWTKPVAFSSIDTKTFEATLNHYQQNPLIAYLNNKYDNDKVLEVAQKYHIGTHSKYNGSVIFWQIDDTNTVRSGKIMGYDTITGKRIKSENSNPDISYVHAELKIQDFNFKQCLYGAHLIKDEVDVYGLVESEKTALIMSLETPEITWLSTNGKGGFKEEMLLPLKSKSIIAFPDKGCYSDWNSKGISLSSMGYNIKVSNILEDMNVKEGDDLADLYSTH
jgi:hypothetical protein